MSPEKLQNDLFSTLSHLLKPEWKDEFIALIANDLVKTDLRIKAGLLKTGDLVCELSQGRISEIAPSSGLTNEDGKNACASICAEAIFYLEQDKKESLTKEAGLYAIMEKGVSAHKNKGYGSSAAVFSELVEEINKGKNGKERKLAAYAPKPSGNGGDLDYFAQMRYDSPLMYPFQAEVKDGFDDYIKMIKTVSAETKRTLYGVLTCGQETVLIYYNQDNTLSLLDSHGRKYLGVSKGASVRKFNDESDLGKHLSSMYEKDHVFSLLMVGVE